MSDIYQQLGIVRWVTKHTQPSAVVACANLIVATIPSSDDNSETEQLLTAMLKSINLTRDDVLMADAKQINASSRLMLAMGEAAAQTLLGTQESLESLRGKLHHYGEQNTQLIVTYHPAHLLRNPADKKKAYADLLFLKAQL